MSFIFGGTDTGALAGVTATLSEWPSFGGLSVESEAVQGRDGRFFAGASRSHSSFVFDVIISGGTPAEVASRRDNFIGLLDPARGPQDLVVETDSAWVFQDVLVASEVQWARVGWDRGVGFTLRADVSLETQGVPDAREASPQRLTYAASGSFTPTRGNTASYPTLEFATGAACVVTVGSFTLNLAATTGGTVVLDWENFEFWVRNSAGAKVRSLVPAMSNFLRPTLRPGQVSTVSVKRGTPFIATVFYPNNRRV